MSRALRYAGVVALAMIVLFVLFIAAPFAIGFVAGCLNASKSAPHLIEVVRYRYIDKR